MGQKITPTLDNSSLKVVPTDTLSNIASTATFANFFCSVRGIPNFSKVDYISSSTSSRLDKLSFFFGAE